MRAKVWGVIEGPTSLEDFPLDSDVMVPEGGHTMLVVKLEVDGEVFDAERWFPDFNSAYEVKRYFDKHMEPFEIDVDIGYY